MCLNIKKTKAMCITLNKDYTLENSNVKINNMTFDFVQEMKHLEVYIENKLSFECHCNYICKKMLKKYHLIRRLSFKLTYWSEIFFV
jgi:hypothetical protein